MNPGDRIVLKRIRPDYLNGVRGTFVREQPGEHRSLVRLDKDPQARKYAGGEWCVSNSQIGPDETAEGIFALIRDNIDPACRASSENWLRDIARIVDSTADEFAARAIVSDNLAEDWENVTKPALLWRFYWHLSNQLRLIAEGHETVMRQGMER